MAALLNDAVTQLSNLDPKSWKTWAGAFATYYIGSKVWKKLTAGPVDTRPSAVHTEKVRIQYPFMAGMIAEEYFGDGADGLGIKVPENAVIVDVGAHFGLFTLEAHARSNYTSTHYCFEPIAQIRERLNPVVLGLDATGDKIKVFPYGLGEKDETLRFTYVAQSPHLSGYKNTDGDVETLLSTDHFVATYYDPDCPPYHKTCMPGWFQYLPRFVGEPLLRVVYDRVMASRPGAEDVECKVRVLSEVFAEQGIERIDILKIDVEGAELDVVKGISNADWAKVQLLAIEVHDNIGNLAPIKKILMDNGLTDIKQVQDMSAKDIMLYQLVARRPSN